MGVKEKGHLYFPEVVRE